jgi:hypothetical protein
LLAIIQLFDSDCEKGYGAFLGVFIVNDDRPRIGLNVDGSYGRGEEVEKVAQGNSEGETVPDYIHVICRTTEINWGGRECEKVGKTMDSEET